MIKLESDLDRKWFKRHPKREYRARLSTAEEAEQVQRLGEITPGMVDRSGPNGVIITVVRNVFPGARVYRWMVATEVPPDTEEFAKWAWDLDDNIRMHWTKK